MTEVSVVIPARNEEANIERVVRSVAAQQGVREIIVVDDGSEDGTPRVLERLGKEIPRLRTVRTDALPEGWVGKNYALETGARLASGDWLLFTDADTYHRPGSLQQLLERAESERAALLSVSPGQQTPTLWEKAVIPFVYARLSRLYRFEEVSDPASPRAAANGQFLLVRRDAYERIDGMESLRGELLEDVGLARRVKQAGGRLVFLPGSRWIETRMYRRVSEMWDGWTKNLFLLYEKRLGRALADVAEIVLLDIAPWVACLVLGGMAAMGLAGRTGEIVGIGSFALALARTWSNGRHLGRIGFEPSRSLYGPVGAAIYVLLLLNSIRAHQWAGRVSWKGRSYSVQGVRNIAP